MSISCTLVHLHLYVSYHAYVHVHGIRVCMCCTICIQGGVLKREFVCGLLVGGAGDWRFFGSEHRVPRNASNGTIYRTWLVSQE